MQLRHYLGNAISLFFLIFHSHSIAQTTYFGSLDLVDYENIPAADIELLESYDSSYRACTSDTCRLLALGLGADLLEHYDLAVAINELTLQFVEEYQDFAKTEEEQRLFKLHLAGALGNKAFFLIDDEMYAQAIAYNKHALDIAKEIQDTSYIAILYNNIGTICDIQGDYQSALKFSLNALPYVIASGFSDDLADSYSNLAATYYSLDSIEKAIVYAHKAIELSDVIDNQTILVNVYSNLGNIYAKATPYPDSAEYYLNKAIDLAQVLDDAESIYIAQSAMTSLLITKKDYPAAELSLVEELIAIELSGEKSEILSSLENLYDIKIQLGKYKEALDIRDQIDSLKEKRRQEEDIFALADLEAEFKYENELAIKDLKAQNLEAASQLKSRIIYIVIIGIILLFLALILIIINRNRLNKSKQKLQELDRINKQIFAVIAHDFKEPIINFNLLLKHLEKNKNPDADFIQELETQIQSSSEMLHNLINWARAELEKQEVRLEKIPIKTLIDQVSTIFQSSAQQKSLSINNLLSEQVTLAGDTVMLEIVFRNLFSNAIKFSPQGGKITIKGDHQTIQIIDEGSGIAPQLKKQLFKGKVNATYGTLGEIGFGLGLLIVHNLLQKNHKTLAISDNHPKGTIFTIKNNQ